MNDSSKDEKRHETSQRKHPQNAALSLTDRVSAWLNTRGTPLEFETAVAFTTAGFEVDQGIHVKQDDERAPLEIDVLAAKQEIVRMQSVLAHDIVVECKFAPEPWVAFAPLNGTARGNAKPIEATTLEAARALIVERQKMAVPPPWPADRIAFGLTAMRTAKDPKEQKPAKDAKDNAYEALVGVVSRARLRRDAFERTNWHTTQLPVIVVGGDLCLARWDEESRQLSVTAVDSCIVLFRGDSVLRTAEVQVVTSRALPEWLVSFSRHIDARHKAIKGTAEAIEAALGGELLRELNLTNAPNERRAGTLLSEALARRTAARRLGSPR